MAFSFTAYSTIDLYYMKKILRAYVDDKAVN